MTGDAAHGVLGTGGTVVLAVYLLGLLLIGWWGRRARQANTMSDHFLAGRSLGLLVLFFTLYATQYSGNTLIGFAGNAYRSGFLMMKSVTAMMAVVAVILLYAPRLRTLAARYDFITPSDYIRFRYNSRSLAVLVSLLCIWAMANYILSNLIAIGAIVETATGGRIPFVWGVIGMSLIMVVYESLGGMRSVAWTDLIQGAILMLGIGLLFVLVFALYDKPSAIGAELLQRSPRLFDPPDGDGNRAWFSTILLLGVGIAVYPHLMQRFFAARSSTALKKSLQLMVFMPFVTTLLVVLAAIVGAWRFDGLSSGESEKVLILLINDMAQRAPVLGVVLVLFVSASVAAIMSTVDSALLTLSSLFTRDLYQPLRPLSDEAHLTAVGKAFSWTVMALMAWLTIVLPQTIWWLITLKLEFFIQIAPAILLGVLTPTVRARAMTGGLVAGVTFTLAWTVLVQGGSDVIARPYGFHAGIWGLAVNLLVVFVLHTLDRSRYAPNRRLVQPPTHTNGSVG